MELKMFSDKKGFVESSTEIIAKTCHFEGSTIALSGGSTPGPVYKSLGERSDVKWDQVSFFQVDERYVPITDPLSNYKLLADNLSKQAHIHSFDTTFSIEKCIADYEEKLREHLTTALSLCVLGIGTDGHFASLFPNSPALNEKEKLAIHTTTDVHDVKDRLTMTLPLIMQSEKILVLLKGDDKWDVIQKMEDESISADEFPARYLMNHHNLIINYLR